MNKEIIAADDSGCITRHYENCANCGGKGTLKVYAFMDMEAGGEKLLRLFVFGKKSLAVGLVRI